MTSAVKATAVQALVALLVVGAMVYVARSAPFLGAVSETEDVVRDAVEAHPVLVRRVEPLPRPLQLCVSTCDVVRLV